MMNIYGMVRTKMAIAYHRFLQRFNKIQPVFIVACGHSGTTLLLRIMGEHTQVHAIKKEMSIARYDQMNFYKWVQIFNAQTAEANKTIWVEKTPRHIYKIDKIFSWLPKSKIILITRDGRDVALSIRKRQGDLKAGIDRWVEDNNAGKPFWKHPQVHMCTYENLVIDPQGTLTKIMEFLGESFHPNMLNYHTRPVNIGTSDKLSKPEGQTEEHHAQYRNWQVNQPLEDKRFLWKIELNQEELAMIDEVAGDLLKELGYEV
jgi:hypothetical protein